MIKSLFLASTVAALGMQLDINRHPDKLASLVLPEGGSSPCLQTNAKLLSEEDLTEAMRSSVADGEVEISVLDYTRTCVPEGQLEFSARSISAVPPTDSGISLWRGRVVPVSGRPVPVWVKARLETSWRCWCAVRFLKAGTDLRETDVVATTLRFRGLPRKRECIDDWRGLRLLTHVPPRQVLRQSMTVALPLLSQGTRVEALLRSGPILLRTHVQVLRSAQLGEVIPVRSTSTPSVRWRARVLSRAEVEIIGRL